MQETEAYITIKDLKKDFPNKIFYLLINLLKYSIEISKMILDKINNLVQSKNISKSMERHIIND